MMIHAHHGTVLPRVTRVRKAPRLIATATRVVGLAALTLFAGCSGNGGTQPGTVRFGQLGDIHLDLEAPLRLGVGTLRQSLTWESTGAWSLDEEVSYRGLSGDATSVSNRGGAGRFAADYASLITQVNDVQGLQLFIPNLPEDLDPECGATRTRLTLTIHDDLRQEDASWTRCVDGSLGNLTAANAGPDPAASRVAVAAQQVREGTQGQDFVSSYNGTVPFGTLDRGSDTPAPLDGPAVITDLKSWQEFWQQHAGNGRPQPTVDFSDEMVVIAAVGVRTEAGDSVEVRRILQVDQGTLIYLVERVPGNFCSPAVQSHRPFHIVVSPKTPEPIRFADVRVEEVDCGS